MWFQDLFCFSAGFLIGSLPPFLLFRGLKGRQSLFSWKNGTCDWQSQWERHGGTSRRSQTPQRLFTTLQKAPEEEPEVIISWNRLPRALSSGCASWALAARRGEEPQGHLHFSGAPWRARHSGEGRLINCVWLAWMWGRQEAGVQGWEQAHTHTQCWEGPGHSSRAVLDCRVYGRPNGHLSSSLGAETQAWGANVAWRTRLVHVRGGRGPWFLTPCSRHAWRWSIGGMDSRQVISLGHECSHLEN